METIIPNKTSHDTPELISAIPNNLSTIGPQVLIMEYETTTLLKEPEGDLFFYHGSDCGIARLILQPAISAMITKRSNANIIKHGSYEDKFGKVNKDTQEIGQEILFTQMVTMLHAGSPFQTTNEQMYEVNLQNRKITMYDKYTSVNLAGEHAELTLPIQIPHLQRTLDGKIQYGFEQHSNAKSLTQRLKDTPKVLFQTQNSRYTTVRLLHELITAYQRQN